MRQFQNHQEERHFVKTSHFWIPLVVVASATTVHSAHAASVDPVLEPGNPPCPEGTIEFKIEPPNPGVYEIDGTGETVNVEINGDDVNWDSTLCMDAVIIKGGPNGNVYQYDPPEESCGDEGLQAPDNNGSPYGISHISFCYDLNLKVEKTVETSFDREWTWMIDKSSDVTELLLSPGQIVSVLYHVLVETSFSDSGHTVSGEISVHNPASVTATITGVTDMVSPDIAATVDCGVTFPYDLAPGGGLLCDYTASLPDGSDRDNTATVTTTGSVDGGEDTEPVEFGDPTNETDECVTVTDDQADPSLLGFVCEGTEFEYELPIGPYECGEHVFMNVATLETNDTGTTDDDDHTITIKVECPDTCTLTQGYWKTHSEYGPAPYDDTWALLPAGADTEFFGSGVSWYDMFWTPPKGDACIQLAYQWLAAFLNWLNGTDTTAIAAELALAETLLDPFDECPNEDQQVVGDLADVLAGFNEGFIGPPHCSE